MEFLWIVVLIAAIALIISDSKAKMLEEDKQFLKEENSSLRDDIRRMINLVQEMKNNNFPKQKSEKINRLKRKNSNIFIFNESGKTDESQNLRDLLKKNSIDGLILVDFKVLSSKLSGKDNAMIEESFLINMNLSNLSIIFYGGNPKDFEDFISHYKWNDRKDICRVEYPFDAEELKKALKEIEKNKI